MERPRLLHAFGHMPSSSLQQERSCFSSQGFGCIAMYGSESREVIHCFVLAFSGDHGYVRRRCARGLQFLEVLFPGPASDFSHQALWLVWSEGWGRMGRSSWLFHTNCRQVSHTRIEHSHVPTLPLCTPCACAQQGVKAPQRAMWASQDKGG